MSLITLGLALDYKTEGGLAATDPITVSSRPFFWQQMERTRANFVTLNDLAPIKMAQVTLDNDQVKALPTTGITVVASPGSSRMLVPIFFVLRANFSSGAYTNVSAAGYLWIGLDGLESNGRTASAYVPNDAGSGLTTLTDLLSATNSIYRLAGYQKANETADWGLVAFGGAQSFVVDKALKIKADNTGDFTVGHTNNTLKITAFYVDLAV